MALDNFVVPPVQYEAQDDSNSPAPDSVSDDDKKKKYEEMVRRISREEGYDDPDLVIAMMNKESDYKKKAVSNKNAQGLLQLIPDTAKRMDYGKTKLLKNPSDIFDPEKNIRLGVRYTKFLSDRFKGNKELIVSGYNAGEGAVEKYNNTVPPYRETINHVKKVGDAYQKLTGKSLLGTAVNNIRSGDKVLDRSLDEYRNSSDSMTADSPSYSRDVPKTGDEAFDNFLAEYTGSASPKVSENSPIPQISGVTAPVSTGDKALDDALAEYGKSSDPSPTQVSNQTLKDAPKKDVYTITAPDGKKLTMKDGQDSKQSTGEAVFTGDDGKEYKFKYTSDGKGGKNFQPLDLSMIKQFTKILGGMTKVDDVPDQPKDVISFIDKDNHVKDFRIVLNGDGDVSYKPLAEIQDPRVKGHKLYETYEQEDKTGKTIQMKDTDGVVHTFDQEVKGNTVRYIPKDKSMQGLHPEGVNAPKSRLITRPPTPQVAEKSSEEDTARSTFENPDTNINNINSDRDPFVRRNGLKASDTPETSTSINTEAATSLPKDRKAQDLSFRIDIKAGDNIRQKIADATRQRLKDSYGLEDQDIEAANKKYPVRFGDTSRASDKQLEISRDTGFLDHKVTASFIDYARKYKQVRLEDVENKKRAQMRIDKGDDPLDSMRAEKVISPEQYNSIKWQMARDQEKEDAAREAWLKENPIPDIEDVRGKTPFSAGSVEPSEADIAKSADLVKKNQQQSMEDIISEYGSMVGYYDEQKRIKEKYGTLFDSYRPLARPLEFAKNFGLAVPKAVASVAKTVPIIQEMLLNSSDMSSVAGVMLRLADLNRRDSEDFKATNSPIYKFADELTKKTEALKNPDFKNEFLINTVPDSLSQVAIQIGLGVVTGGATVPVLFGASQGLVEQYDDADKGGASDSSRRLAALIGGVAAISDAIPFGKFLSPLDKIGKTTFIGKYLGSIFAKSAEHVSEKEAVEITRGAIAKLMSKGKIVLEGMGMEGLQELSEKKINDLVARTTYDQNRKVFQLSKEDFMEFAGGAVGGVGGASVEIALETEHHKGSDVNLKPSIDDILVKYNKGEKQVTPEVGSATGEKVSENSPTPETTPEAETPKAGKKKRVSLVHVEGTTQIIEPSAGAVTPEVKSEVTEESTPEPVDKTEKKSKKRTSLSDIEATPEITPETTTETPKKEYKPVHTGKDFTVEKNVDADGRESFTVLGKSLDPNADNALGIVSTYKTLDGAIEAGKTGQIQGFKEQEFLDNKTKTEVIDSEKRPIKIGDEVLFENGVKTPIKGVVQSSNGSVLMVQPYKKDGTLMKARAVDSSNRVVTLTAPLTEKVSENSPIPEISATTAAHDAATSPLNDLPHPTEAQIEAGNFQKGHININGLGISIENPVGSTREGVDRDGTEWSTTLANHYGYIKRTLGNDKENIDVFVKDNTPENFAGDVYVIDQIHPDTGKFDEHKIMLGFSNEKEAREAYSSNYAKDWKGLKNITSMPFDEFKIWTKFSQQTKPVKPITPDSPTLNPTATKKLQEIDDDLEEAKSDLEDARNRLEDAQDEVQMIKPDKTEKMSKDEREQEREYHQDAKDDLAEVKAEVKELEKKVKSLDKKRSNFVLKHDEGSNPRVEAEKPAVQPAIEQEKANDIEVGDLVYKKIGNNSIPVEILSVSPKGIVGYRDSQTGEESTDSIKNFTREDQESVNPVLPPIKEQIKTARKANSVPVKVSNVEKETELSTRADTLYKDGHIGVVEYQTIQKLLLNEEHGKLETFLDKAEEDIKNNSYSKTGNEVIKGKIGTNTKALLALIGEQMYRADLTETTLKETVQNSFDAVKSAFAQGLTKNQKIDISIDHENRVITVTDNGVGMTEDIIHNAFLTLGGTNKEGSSQGDNSGGFGMAKAAFLFGNKMVEVETTRDGVTHKFIVTPDDIDSESGINITKTQTPKRKSGTTLKITVPENITSSTGNTRNVYLPMDLQNTNFFSKPLLGDVEITFQNIWKHNADAKEVVPVGKNFDYENAPLFTTVDFSWGEAKVYVSNDKKMFANHTVLSSGIYQFDTHFEVGQFEKFPYDVIIDIKTKVKPDHVHYPFTIQREGFKHTVDNDIKALKNYFKTLGALANAEETVEQFKEMRQLPRVKVGKTLTTQEESDVKESFTEKRKQVKPEAEKFDKVTISEGIATGIDKRGKTVTLAKSEEQKSAPESFKSDKELKKASDFLLESNLDPDKPVYHNNTNVDWIEYGKEFGNPEHFFSQIGSIVSNFRDLISSLDISGFDALNSKDNPYFTGLSIDKGYYGVNIRVPYKAFFLNPIAVPSSVKGLQGVVANMYYTLVHEAVHLAANGHNESFTSKLHEVQTALTENGVDIKIRTQLESVYKNHRDLYNAFREKYERFDTKNVRGTLEGDHQIREGLKGEDGGDAVGVRDGVGTFFYTPVSRASESSISGSKGRSSSESMGGRTEGTQTTEDDQRASNNIGLKSKPTNRDLSNLGSFNLAGELAVLSAEARMNRQLAEQMEKDNALTSDIYQKTGWERGKDGKWRYELLNDTDILMPSKEALIRWHEKQLSKAVREGWMSEKDANIRANEAYSNPIVKVLQDYNNAPVQMLDGSYQLDELLDSPKLFEAYPELSKMKVVFTPLGSELAHFAKNANTIRVNSNYTQEKGNVTQTELIDLLIHEVQHYIQEKEGFAVGANSKEFMFVQEAKDSAQAEISRLHDVSGIIRTAFLNEDMRIGDVIKLYRERNPNMDKYAVSEAIRHIDTLIAGRFNPEVAKVIFRSIDDKVSEYYDRLKQLSQIKGKTPTRMYMQTAGEVEARNAGRRVSEMTVEQRKIKPPMLTEDIGRSNQWVKIDQTISGIESPKSLSMLEPSAKLSEEDSATFGILRTKSIGELSDTATASRAIDGISIRLNEPAVELIRRVAGMSQAFDGVAIPSAQARGLVGNLLNLARESKAQGKIEQGNSIYNIAKTLRDVYRTSESVPIMFLTDDSLGEEKFHRQRMLNALTQEVEKALAPEHVDILFNSIPSIGVEGLISQGYPESPAVLVDEVAAKLSNGKWQELGFKSEDDSMEWLLDWGDSFIKHNNLTDLNGFKELSDYTSNVFSQIDTIRSKVNETENTDNETNQSESEGSPKPLADQQSDAREANRVLEEDSQGEPVPVNSSGESIEDQIKTYNDSIGQFMEQGEDKPTSFAQTVFDYVTKDFDPKAIAQKVVTMDIQDAIAQATIERFEQGDLIGVLRESSVRDFIPPLGFLSAGHRIIDSIQNEVDSLVARRATDFEIDAARDRRDEVIRYVSILENKAGRIVQSIQTWLRNNPLYRAERAIRKASKGQTTKLDIETERDITNQTQKIRELTKEVERLNKKLDAANKAASEANREKPKTEREKLQKKLKEKLNTNIDIITGFFRKMSSSLTGTPPVLVPARTSSGYDTTVENALVDFSTALLLDRLYDKNDLTVDQFDQALLRITDGKLTQSELDSIHSRAMTAIRETFPKQSDEAKDRARVSAQARYPHYKRVKTTEWGLPDVRSMIIDEAENPTNDTLSIALGSGIYNKYRDAIKDAALFNNARPAKTLYTKNEVARFIRDYIKQTDPSVTLSFEDLSQLADSSILLTRVVEDNYKNTVNEKKAQVTEEVKAERKQLTKELRSKQFEINKQISNIERDPSSILRRIDRVMVGQVISRWSTAIANQVSARGVKNIFMLEDVVDLAIQKATGLEGDKLAPTREERFRDQFKGFFSTSIVASIINRSQINDLLESYPAEAEKLIGDIEHKIKTTNKSTTRKLLEVPLTAMERWTDISLIPSMQLEKKDRTGVVINVLDKRLRARDENLTDVLKNGDYEKITARDWEVAIEKARFITAALSPENETLKKTINLFSNSIPLVGNPLKFARVIYNISKFTVERNPAFALGRIAYKGGRTIIENRRGSDLETLEKYKIRSSDFTKFLSGSAMLGIAVAMRGAFGDDKDWKKMRVPFTDTHISVQRYQPFASYWFLASVIKDLSKGQYNATFKDWAEGVTGLSMIQNPFWDMIWQGDSYGNVANSVFDGMDLSDKTVEQLGQVSKKFGGTTAGVFMTSLSNIKVLMESLGIEEAFEPDRNRAPFLAEIRDRMPFASKFMSDDSIKQDAVTGGKKKRYSNFGRMVGIEPVAPEKLDKPLSQAEYKLNQLDGDPNVKPRSSEEKYKSDIKYQLINARQKGLIDDSTFEKRVRFYIDSDVIPATDYETVLEAGRKSKLSIGFDRLKDIKDKEEVYKRTTQEEKDSGLEWQVQKARAAELKKPVEEKKAEDDIKLKTDVNEADTLSDKNKVLAKETKFDKTKMKEIAKKYNVDEKTLEFVEKTPVEQVALFNVLKTEEEKARVFPAMLKKVAKLDPSKATPEDLQLRDTVNQYFKDFSKLPSEQKQRLGQIQIRSAMAIDAIFLLPKK